MAEQQQSISPGASAGGRGRGRGKSRGGLGKYLRARGRGRGQGRPALFTERLVLEGEQVVELDPESEEAKELERRYARRQLGSNADRYAEPEPELGSDGEEIVEPEVDLSSFLEKQKLSDDIVSTVSPPVEDDDDVDHSLDHLSSRRPVAQSKKGRTETVEWDEQLEEMRREKDVAEANRDLKARFRAKSDKLRASTAPKLGNRERKQADSGYVEAPPLPTESVVTKDSKIEMQDFLDDLLG